MQQSWDAVRFEELEQLQVREQAQRLSLYERLCWIESMTEVADHLRRSTRESRLKGTE